MHPRPCRNHAGWLLVFLMPLFSYAQATGQSSPQPTDLAQRQVRSLAATCAACHGTDGHAVPGSAIPALAGMEKDAFVDRMSTFRDGSRPATVMHQISKGYSPAQIDALAQYFSSLKGAP